MGFIDFLYGTTIWNLSLVVCTIVVGGTIAAMVVIDRLWNKELRRTHNDIAGFLIAVVGVVFAILVSSLTVEVLARQDRAETLVTREAETLEAFYRDADLLQPAQRESLRTDTRAYLDAVIDGDWPQMREATWPRASDAGRERLWRDVAALPVESFAQVLSVQELRGHLEKLGEIRRDRAEIATSGVDPVVWGVVLLGSISTLLFAAIFGVSNFAAHLLMTGLLAFTIALAIIMLVAIDWPYYGHDSVAPLRLIELRTGLTQNVK